jgi:hypothetical protein
MCFLTDASDKPMPSGGFKGMAILVTQGKAGRIPRAPDQGNRLTGKTGAALPANAKHAVQFTAPDGSTA